MFFFDPTQVAARRGAAAASAFRLGGMVKQGSVTRAPGSLEVHFVVTDFSHEVPVSYTRCCRICFARAPASSRTDGCDADGTFVADEVLAKHDEKYMPPEVARSLKRRHGESRARAAPAQRPRR